MNWIDGKPNGISEFVPIGLIDFRKKVKGKKFICT